MVTNLNRVASKLEDDLLYFITLLNNRFILSSPFSPPHSPAPSQTILWGKLTGLILHIKETPSESHHWIYNSDCFCTYLLFLLSESMEDVFLLCSIVFAWIPSPLTSTWTSVHWIMFLSCVFDLIFCNVFQPCSRLSHAKIVKKKKNLNHHNKLHPGRDCPSVPSTWRSPTHLLVLDASPLCLQGTCRWLYCSISHIVCWVQSASELGTD